MDTRTQRTSSHSTDDYWGDTDCSAYNGLPNQSKDEFSSLVTRAGGETNDRPYERRSVIDLTRSV